MKRWRRESVTDIWGKNKIKGIKMIIEEYSLEKEHKGMGDRTALHLRLAGMVLE